MTLTDTKPTVSDEVRSSFDLSRFADETATAVVRRVAGLGDRNSPDDWPEAMLVTGKELHLIVSSELAEDDLLSRVRTLEEAMRKAVKIIDTNLYHQREKVQDASTILRQALGGQ